MEFATYYFTLLVMLASVLAATTCFSAYLASRARSLILGFGGFLCYFADTALMLQDSIATAVLGTATDPSYLLARSVATVVIEDAFLTFFWLLVCNFIGERKTAIKCVPPLLFLLISFALLANATSFEGRFWFYSMRMFYVVWILGYAFVRYLTCHDSTERVRLARGRVIFVVVAVLTILVIAEDVLMFLVLRVDQWALGPIVISAERNYAENLSMLACSLLAIFHAGRSLALRFIEPPADEDELRASHIGTNLALYSNRHGLTDREREVLQLVLQGKDNQNIASALTVAPSTVKVYVHRLLKKTECESRQALIQDFWKGF